MNELIDKMKTLEGEVAQLEKTAQSHEKAATQARLDRAMKKQELAELRALVHDTKVSHAVDGSMQAAKTAAEAAEAAKSEASALLESLKLAAESVKAKEAELDKLIAKAAEEQIAKAAAKKATAAMDESMGE